MRLYITLLFLLYTLLAQAQISGKVVSERGETLPGALVLLLPDSASTITDANGSSAFSNLRPGRYALEVSFF
ncbi:MAG TPA: carboxypeptidase regulatory-like domain-containing protein, partial [Saprospiraceae bacterium]|nr:carboxypeptidase regulatory-like domain-containing protein [Saprospiraceae bacterium]